jgi:diguanylate cyclase (GGDEF)-like protein
MRWKTVSRWQETGVRRWLERFLLPLLLLLPCWAMATAPLQLTDRVPRVEVWPAVTVLSDPGKQMTLAEARAAVERFAPPTTARNTLGHRRDAVWLRVPLQVSRDSEGRWLLDIDYAVLNRVDVFVLGPSGLLLQQARLGNLQPAANRPLPTRSHAVDLQLLPGQAHEIWLRVETLGGMIVPITLSRESAFLERALHEQMLQGLLTGLGLCLVFYSLAQWITLRERLLLKYALLIGSGVLFSVVQFGIGAQFIWFDALWFELHLAGIAALLASAGTFLFVEEVLRGPERHRWFSPVMKGGAAFLAAVAWAYGLDFIDVHVVSKVIGTVGLAPALMGLPGAIQLARRGNSVGWYFIVAWLGYFISTSVMVATIRGSVPANFWSLHSFQFGTTLDMLLFLRVLALRLHAVHEEALRTASERDHALSMAATDALTGLPNRRGMNQALAEALPHSSALKLSAVYLFDLDGFKPVNDEHGHDVGDGLLVAVAERLRAKLRAVDMVARLGGDEFVVLASGLQTAHHAEQLGEQLLRAFDEPFAVQGLSLQLGATIGYALAPLDGDDAATLLQRADAAMYEGKRQGKGCLRRTTREP